MAYTTTLRHLDGSTVIDIPDVFLRKLHCTSGDEVELRANRNFIEIRPKKKKLSLAERLSMYEKALAYRTQEDVSQDRIWDRMPATGREI